MRRWDLTSRTWVEEHLQPIRRGRRAAEAVCQQSKRWSSSVWKVIRRPQWRIRMIQTYGITKRAICYTVQISELKCISSGGTVWWLTMLEPTATPILRVSLSLSETVTAVTCSAAFPTIGSKIRPTHSLLILPLSVTPLMLSTSHSAVTATS